MVKNHSDSNPKKISEADIIKMLDSLIDNIFVTFGGPVFRQTVGVVTNYVPLLAGLFLCYYEADFIQELRMKDKKLAISFNFTFRYKDDVLSLNNSKVGNYVKRIYPITLEKKDTKDTVTPASYLDLHLEMDNEGRLKTKKYDKRDDYSFLM